MQQSRDDTSGCSSLVGALFLLIVSFNDSGEWIRTNTRSGRHECRPRPLLGK
ncbi:MAG: YczI family protein [Acidobacteria bacterium]|nr:YczI family protein [Acidobacteriota bacterium]